VALIRFERHRAERAARSRYRPNHTLATALDFCAFWRGADTASIGERAMQEFQ